MRIDYYHRYRRSRVTIRRNEQTGKTFPVYRWCYIMTQDQRSRDCAISIETALHFSFLSFLSYWRSTRKKEKRTMNDRDGSKFMTNLLTSTDKLIFSQKNHQTCRTHCIYILRKIGIN